MFQIHYKTVTRKLHLLYVLLLYFTFNSYLFIVLGKKFRNMCTCVEIFQNVEMSANVTHTSTR
jgi:hypothetical protein